MSFTNEDYIQNLNQEPMFSETPAMVPSNLDAELSIFSNSNFFDFDMGSGPQLQKKSDMDLSPLFDTQNVASPAGIQSNNNLDLVAELSQIDFAVPQTQTLNYTIPSPHPTVLPVPRGAAATSKKRSFSPDFVSSEEDKKKRNTAASARFRVKKKMREQQMERATKELKEKVDSLKTQILKLEMENKWLRTMVIEKNEARDRDEFSKLKQKILESSKEQVKLEDSK